MRDTGTETVAAEYDRLCTEGHRLAAQATRTPEDRARAVQISARLRAIRATPPPGYTLPSMATALIAHATAHGWQTLAQWTPAAGLDEGGRQEPFVTVQVGRRLTADELAARAEKFFQGPHWLYSATWWSRGLPHGRLRLHRVSAETPDAPACHEVSLRTAREAITAHPAP